MGILVIGGTGTVGSRVVEGLVARGRRPRVLTRQAERASDLPEEAEAVVGDLGDPASYDRVFSGAQTIFLLNALSLSELQEGLAAVNEAERAGTRRIVYLSVQHADRGLHIPHFGAKWVIEEALRRTGIPTVVLRPSSFFQNDLWLRDAILEHGAYPQPLGDIGVSRVDVRDIAEAAVRALLDTEVDAGTYEIVGPEPLTVSDCAEAWSRTLGRPVTPLHDIEAWTRQMSSSLPGWMLYDVRLMFEHFHRHGLAASDTELARTRALLGRDPRSFDDFVRETARSWT